MTTTGSRPPHPRSKSCREAGKAPIFRPNRRSSGEFQFTAVHCPSGGGNMKKFGASAAVILGLAGAASATDASADDIMVTKAAPAVTAKAAPQPATCGSLEDFVVTNCPLTWNGITVYGTIDAGVTWRSHGAPFNGTSAVREDY